MRVELWIEFARGVVAEGGCTEVACRVAMFVVSLPGLDGSKPFQFRQGLTRGSIVRVIEPSVFHHDGHDGDGLLSGALKIKETNRVLRLSRRQLAGTIRMLVESQRFESSIVLLDGLACDA